MKKIFIVLCALISFSQSFGQSAGNDTTQYIYYKFTYGNKLDRYWAKKVLLIPADTIYSKDGIALKNGIFYTGNGIKWSQVTGGGGSTDTSSLSTRINLKLDSIRRKAGSDSVFMYSNGVKAFAFRDSIGTVAAFDSATSQGAIGAGGFHTQGYNDLRYKRANDSIGANGFVTHNQDDSAKQAIRNSIALKKDISDSLLTEGYTTHAQVDSAKINLRALIAAKVSNLGLASGIKAGAYLSRPSATNSQTFYWSTDSAFWSYDGAGPAWKDLKPGTTGGGGTTGVDSVWTTPDTLNYHTSTGNKIAQIRQQVYGTIYNPGSQLLTDWTVVGATAAQNGNNIDVSGGSNTFTKYLKQTTYGLTGLEHWKKSFWVQATSKNSNATDGFGIGLFGTSFNVTARFFQTNNADSGQVALYFPKAAVNNTLMAQSTGNLSFAINDTIQLDFERSIDAFVVTATNISKGSTTNQTIPYTINPQESGNSGQTYVGSGYFSFYTFGGTHSIIKSAITSTEGMDADNIILTDSKGTITTNAGSLSEAFPAIFKRGYPNTIISAGPSDRGTEAINKLHEIIALARPGMTTVYVLIGRNDLANANADNDTIYNRLTRSGIKVMFLLPLYETTLNQTALRDHLISTYPNNYIDTYTPTIPYSVSIHPSWQMHETVANVMINAKKATGFKPVLQIASGGQIPFGGTYGFLKTHGNFWYDLQDSALHIGQSTIIGTNSAGYHQINLNGLNKTLASSSGTYNFLGQDNGALLNINTPTGTMNFMVGLTTQVAITNSLFTVSQPAVFNNYIRILSGNALTWGAGNNPSIYGSSTNSTIDFATATGTTSRMRYTASANLIVGRTMTVNGFALDNGRRIQDSGTLQVADSTFLDKVPTGTSSDSVLVWNASDHSVRKVAQSSIGGGGGGNPFADNTAILKNNADNTKLLKFDLSGITTATTRTITVPDANFILPGLGITQTWTGTNTFPAPKITGLSSAPATDSILTVDPATGQTHFIAQSKPVNVYDLGSGTPQQRVNAAGDSLNIRTVKVNGRLADTASDGTILINTGPVFVGTADAAQVTNTTSPGDLNGTGVGSLSFAANFFSAGNVIKIRSEGIISTDATNPAINIGGNLFGTATGVLNWNTGSLVNAYWWVELTGVIRTTGSSGTIYWTAKTVLNGVENDYNIGTNTINTTTTQAITTFTATWTTASTNNKITGKTFIVKME